MRRNDRAAWVAAEMELSAARALLKAYESLIVALKEANLEKDKAIDDLVASAHEQHEVDWFRWVAADTLADRKATVH